MLYPMWWSILGCAEPTDTGSDTDSEPASDTDTGELAATTGDTGTAPCPFAGAWDLVEIDAGDGVPFEPESGANMAGSAELCEWDLLVVRGNCRQHELAVFEAEPFGAWTAWSDGAPDTSPEGCGLTHEPFESSAWPELSDDGSTLSLRYGSAMFYGQSVTYRFQRLN